MSPSNIDFHIIPIIITVYLSSVMPHNFDSCKISSHSSICFTTCKRWLLSSAHPISLSLGFMHFELIELSEDSSHREYITKAKNLLVFSVLTLPPLCLLNLIKRKREASTIRFLNCSRIHRRQCLQWVGVWFSAVRLPAF